jgi:modulator of FtsH protease
MGHGPGNTATSAGAPVAPADDMITRMPEGWSDFFVATAGAAAALAGLIIVAMTVNIQTILSIPSMTSRAGATIASLVLIVVTAAAGLIPGQGLQYLAGEILLFTVGAAVLAVDSAVRMLRSAEAPYRGVTWFKAVLAVGQVVPFAVGGVLLATDNEGGLYWVAAGILLVFVVSVANAWVLLVEILR